MSERLKSFLKDRHVFIPFISGSVFWIIIFIIFFFKIYPLEDNIIFHINLNKEVDFLGGAGVVLLAIIIFLISFLFNYLISYVLYFRERILSYFFSYLAVWAMFLGLIFIYTVSVLN